MTKTTTTPPSFPPLTPSSPAVRAMPLPHHIPRTNQRHNHLTLNPPSPSRNSPPPPLPPWRTHSSPSPTPRHPLARPKSATPASWASCTLPTSIQTRPRSASLLLLAGESRPALWFGEENGRVRLWGWLGRVKRWREFGFLARCGLWCYWQLMAFAAPYIKSVCCCCLPFWAVYLIF